jgi:hypothetical protein
VPSAPENTPMMTAEMDDMFHELAWGGIRKAAE